MTAKLVQPEVVHRYKCYRHLTYLSAEADIFPLPRKGKNRWVKFELIRGRAVTYWKVQSIILVRLLMIGHLADILQYTAHVDAPEGLGKKPIERIQDRHISMQGISIIYPDLARRYLCGLPLPYESGKADHIHFEICYLYLPVLILHALQHCVTGYLSTAKQQGLCSKTGLTVAGLAPVLVTGAMRDSRHDDKSCMHL